MNRWVALAIALGTGCKHHDEPPAPGPGLVPHVHAPIVIDGSWSEPEWNSLALTGDFVDDDRRPARPVSQIRLLVDDRRLLLGLYAADEDIRATEHFDVAIGPVTLQFDPTGRVTPEIAGVHATVDTDGTIDKPDDYDEEWVIEADVPLALVGLAPGGPAVPIHASRCDVTKDGVRRCGGWSALIHL